MIRWRLDPIRTGGPQNIVHVSLPIPPETAGRWAKRGELRLTPAEYDDLLVRLAIDPAEVERMRQELGVVQRERDLAIAHDRQPYPTAWAYERACAAREKHRQRANIAEAERDALAAQIRALGDQIGNHDDGEIDVWSLRQVLHQMPCARCGQPVPAGQATHGDCAPLVCNFCTQCGKRLSADERAAKARVCLVACAPLAGGLVVGEVVDRYSLHRALERLGNAEQPGPKTARRRLHEIPHLAVTPVRYRYDLGDSIARQHGVPVVTTACDVEAMTTLTTRRRDKVRCPGCLGAMAAIEDNDPAPVELEPGESEGPDIATSTTSTEQPAAPHQGPAPYLPEQRDGGA